MQYNNIVCDKLVAVSTDVKQKTQSVQDSLGGKGGGNVIILWKSSGWIIHNLYCLK